MLRNDAFVRLSLIASCNFGALFVYISSASAFVLDILHLNAQQFGWFFAPTISGMMLGAFTSGRLAGRVDSHTRSEEHTSELQSLMRNSHAVFCLNKKNIDTPMPPSTSK